MLNEALFHRVVENIKSASTKAWLESQQERLYYMGCSDWRPILRNAEFLMSYFDENPPPTFEQLVEHFKTRYETEQAVRIICIFISSGMMGYHEGNLELKYGSEEDDPGEDEEDVELPEEIQMKKDQKEAEIINKKLMEEFEEKLTVKFEEKGLQQYIYPIVSFKKFRTTSIFDPSKIATFDDDEIDKFAEATEKIVNEAIKSFKAKNPDFDNEVKELEEIIKKKRFSFVEESKLRSLKQKKTSFISSIISRVFNPFPGEEPELDVSERLDLEDNTGDSEDSEDEDPEGTEYLPNL